MTLAATALWNEELLSVVTMPSDHAKTLVTPASSKVDTTLNSVVHVTTAALPLPLLRRRRPPSLNAHVKAHPRMLAVATESWSAMVAFNAAPSQSAGPADATNRSETSTSMFPDSVGANVSVGSAVGTGNGAGLGGVVGCSDGGGVGASDGRDVGGSVGVADGSEEAEGICPFLQILVSRKIPKI